MKKIITIFIKLLLKFKLKISLIFVYVFIFLSFLIFSNLYFASQASKHLEDYLLVEKYKILDEILNWVQSLLLDIKKDGEWEEESIDSAYDLISNFRYWEKNLDFLTLIDKQFRLQVHPIPVLLGQDITPFVDEYWYAYWKEIVDSLKQNQDRVIQYYVKSWDEPWVINRKIFKATYVDDFDFYISAWFNINDIDYKKKEMFNRLFIPILSFEIIIIILLLFLWIKTYSIATTKKSIEKDYESLINNLPVWIFRAPLFWDPDTPPITYNQELLDIFWFNREDFQHKYKLRDYFDSDNDYDRYTNTFGSFFKNPRKIRWKEFRMKKVNWDIIWISFFASKIEKNWVIYMDWAMLDITEKYNLINKLTESYQKLKKVDLLKDNIIAITSHELQTPLTIIKWYASILIETNKWNCDKKQLEFLESIISNSNKMIKDVWNMLDISKIESWKLEVKKEKIEIVNFIKNIVNDFKIKVKEERQDKHIIFNDKQEKIFVYSDKYLLRRILINLISNWIKYSNDDYWFIEIFIEKINNLEIQVHIKDNWNWIKKENKENIFERFIQIDWHLNRNKWWIWLWLAIVKWLLKRLWSEIKLDSEIWKWSDFYFNLEIYTK